MIREKYQSAVARPPKLAASPQIRNQGTIGGNVSQDARCWYYRGGWPCYRAGGNICYADTPTGRNREHAILRRGPLRGRESVRLGAGADRARREDGDSHAQRASAWSMPRITSSALTSTSRA